jgi:aryl sulfotransferase
MNGNAAGSVPLAGAFWDAGAEVFVDKGVNGRWTETLTREDCAAYHALAESNLGSECSRCLTEGSGS